MEKPWRLGNKLDKKWKKNKDIEWRYVKGKRTPFRNGKELKIGTRPKELIKAAGSDLSNAFRDVLKIGRVGKNPQFNPETGKPLNLLEAQRLNKLNDEKLLNYDGDAVVADYAKTKKEAEVWNNLEKERTKSKVLHGEDLMKVYGPGGAKYDEEDDGEFEVPNTTKLQVARSLSTGGDPIPPDLGGKGGVSESKASGSSSGSTVHTRHYKTGERLGVMGRSQRRAYDKEAAGRTFESEVAKYEKSSGHGKSHLRETLYKRNLRKNKKKLSIDD